MSSYELQTYRDGQWKFDSYFDQRDLVLSEATRLDRAGRYMGVRVLEELFDEQSQTSNYKTIFSRLRRVDNGRVAKPAKSAKPAAKSGAVRAGGNGAKSRAGGATMSSRQIQRREGKKSGTSPLWLLGIASVLVLVGIGAVIVLRSLAGSG